MRPKRLATLAAAITALAVPTSTAVGQSSNPATAAGLETTSQTQASRLRGYILGNIYFLAYHEFGHAIVSEFDVPIAGREEDAVDRLAAWMMTPDPGEGQPEYLLVTIDGWFSAAAEKSLDQIAWWGQHGTEEQRGYQVACLLYGDNPPLYKEIADAAELPPERRQSCAKEAKRNARAWDRLTDPFSRSEDAGDAAPQSSVNLTYAPTQTFAWERELAMQDGVLEELRRLITETYKFKPGITLAMEECGEPNAFWNERERKLLICYDLVRAFKHTGEATLAEGG